jgi:hypothetical protein
LVPERLGHRHQVKVGRLPLAEGGHAHDLPADLVLGPATALDYRDLMFTSIFLR